MLQPYLLRRLTRLKKSFNLNNAILPLPEEEKDNWLIGVELWDISDESERMGPQLSLKLPESPGRYKSELEDEESWFYSMMLAGNRPTFLP